MGYDHLVRQWILDHRFLTVLKLIGRFLSDFYAAPTLSSPLTKCYSGKFCFQKCTPAVSLINISKIFLIFFLTSGNALFFFLFYHLNWNCKLSISLLTVFIFSDLLSQLCNKLFSFSILAGKSPFGQLPVMEIKDAASSEPIVLCQSVAILRYLANEFGMYSIF